MLSKVISAVYQPILEVGGTGRIAYFEALTRLRNKPNGHRALIDYAESEGFIDVIDLHILQTVLALLGEQAVPIAVNLSVVTLEQSCNSILSLIYKHMDVASRLVCEITESARIHNLALIEKFVAAVRVLGVKIAIDDFGSGFFVLDAMGQPDVVLRLRPDYLKLSEVMIADLPAYSEQIKLLSGIVKGYGGELIAEHIDSKSKLDALSALGVRYAQGYFLGVPAPGLQIIPVREDIPQQVGQDWQACA